jgi:hypothetical protein
MKPGNESNQMDNLKTFQPAVTAWFIIMQCSFPQHFLYFTLAVYSSLMERMFSHA